MISSRRLKRIFEVVDQTVTDEGQRLRVKGGVLLALDWATSRARKRESAGRSRDRALVVGQLGALRICEHPVLNGGLGGEDADSGDGYPEPMSKHVPPIQT